MSGDWIKMRACLIDHPKVLAMSRVLRENRGFIEWAVGSHAQSVTVSHEMSRTCLVGALLRVWSVARQHGEFVGSDLNLPHNSPPDIDQMSGVPGIADALKSVGWMTDKDGVTLPNFKTYNVPFSDAERQERRRLRLKNTVTDTSRTVTQSHEPSRTRGRERVETETEKKSESETLIPIAPTASRIAAVPAVAKIAWTPSDGWTGITEAERSAWAKAYPACVLDRQLAAMTEWLRANPTKAHKSNWRKFISGWLSRSQDRGGDAKSVAPNGRFGEPAYVPLTKAVKW